MPLDSRHLHSNTQALYQQANIVDTDKRQEAMNPSLLNKASSPGDDENSSHSSSIMRSGDSVPASSANCGVSNIMSPSPTTSFPQGSSSVGFPLPTGGVSPNDPAQPLGVQLSYVSHLGQITSPPQFLSPLVSGSTSISVHFQQSLTASQMQQSLAASQFQQSLAAAQYQQQVAVSQLQASQFLCPPSLPPEPSFSPFQAPNSVPNSDLVKQIVDELKKTSKD